MDDNMITGTYTINGEDISFKFFTSLDAYKKSKFVVSVSNMLFGDNYYNHIIKDLAFDFCIIAIFTDIDTSYVQNANNGIVAMEEFVEKFNNVIDIVKTNVSDDIIEELHKAIELNIEYRTGIHADGSL